MIVGEIVICGYLLIFLERGLMTNLELIKVLVTLFSDFFKYFMPVAGLVAGTNLVINWIWSILFKPFQHM